MAEELPGGCRGGDQPPGDDLGRRTAATGDSAPAGGRFHGGCAPHCRRRKVRSAPFPPAAKTAPAPLLLLSPPRGARRGPLSVLPKEKWAVHGPKRKVCGALRCSGPPRCRRSTYRCKRRFWPAFGHAWAFCDFPNCRPMAGVPTLSGWLSHGIASLFAAAGCPSGELA